jgi:hypothetical protein
MSKPVVILSSVGPDGKKWSVPVCPKCRRTCLDVRMAEECCEPRVCECGQPCAPHRTACDECVSRHNAMREAARIDKAEKIQPDSYAGPVYLDGSGGNDGYHASLDNFVEEWLDEHDGLPAYVEACNEIMLSLSACDIIDAALESGEFHDEARDYISDSAVAEMQSFLSDWCDRYAPTSWLPNGKFVTLNSLITQREG